MSFELFSIPIVESIGEEKFAIATAAIVDRYPREGEVPAMRLFTRFVKVHYATER